MAKKKAVSPMLQKPKKPLGLGDFLTDYSQPMGSFAMPSPMQDLQPMVMPVGAVPPTQQAVTPEVEQPQAFAMDSGLSRQNQATMQNKDIQEFGSKRDIPVAPEDVQAMIDATRAIPGYAERENSLAGMEQALAGRLERAPSTVDISPLMALSDAWTGSKFAGTYKAPKSPSETILEEMGKIQTGRKDLTQQVIDMLKIKKGQEYDKNLLELITGTKTVAGSKAPSSPKVTNPQDKFNPYTESSRIAKVAQKEIGSIAQHSADLKQLDALMQGAPSIATMNQVASIAARVIAREKGVLTENDVNRSRFQTLEDQFKTLAGRLTGDPSSPANAKVVEELKKNVRTARKALYESSSGRLKSAMDVEKATEGGKRLGTVDTIFAPGFDALKDIESKSDFEKFLEGVKARQAGGGKK